MQSALTKTGKPRQAGASVATLNNVLMQMRKNCNHPDLITAAFDGSVYFPSAADLIEQCGKMRLMDRLLRKLKAAGHKVLIFSQARMSAFWCGGRTPHHLAARLRREHAPQYSAPYADKWGETRRTC